MYVHSNDLLCLNHRLMVFYTGAQREMMQSIWFVLSALSRSVLQAMSRNIVYRIVQIF
jgi:hypothetical protein